MAHMDELSMIVKRVEPDGALHVTQLGTMYSRQLRARSGRDTRR